MTLAPGSVNLVLDGTDPDGDPLSYTVVGGRLPDGLSLSQGGIITGEVLGIQGSWVTVQACDPVGSCATQTIRFSGAVLPETSTAEAPDATVPEDKTDLLTVVALVSFLGCLLVASRPRSRRA